VSEQTVTKQELANAVKDLATKRDLAEAVQQNKRDLAEATEKLTEAIRDSQTEVLRAFYNWARPIEVRLNRTNEIATRLSWIEERVAALERGKLPLLSKPVSTATASPLADRWLRSLE
jgi:hypothetical protein